MDFIKSTRCRLASLVVNIELTLVSIIQGVALSFLAGSSRNDPLRWYAFNAVFAVLAWLVFFIDLRRMIYQRQSEAAGPGEAKLYDVVIRDHYKNILLLMPGMTLLNFIAVGGICFWPEVLIQGGGHVVFAMIQTAAFLGYLIYVVRFFAIMAPIVLRANQEDDAGFAGA